MTITIDGKSVPLEVSQFLENLVEEGEQNLTPERAKSLLDENFDGRPTDSDFTLIENKFEKPPATLNLNNFRSCADYLASIKTEDTPKDPVLTQEDVRILEKGGVTIEFNRNGILIAHETSHKPRNHFVQDLRINYHQKNPGHNDKLYTTSGTPEGYGERIYLVKENTQKGPILNKDWDENREKISEHGGNVQANDYGVLIVWQTSEDATKFGDIETVLKDMLKEENLSWHSHTTRPTPFPNTPGAWMNYTTNFFIITSR